MHPRVQFVLLDARAQQSCSQTISDVEQGLPETTCFPKKKEPQDQVSTEFTLTSIIDLLITPPKLHSVSPERKIQV